MLLGRVLMALALEMVVLLLLLLLALLLFLMARRRFLRLSEGEGVDDHAEAEAHWVVDEAEVASGNEATARIAMMYAPNPSLCLYKTSTLSCSKH